MIPVQEAVKKAVAFAGAVLEPQRVGTILLEEVEPATENGEEVWKITLSLTDPGSPLSFSGHRQYKTFTVNADTGEVVSMTIRQLNGST